MTEFNGTPFQYNPMVTNVNIDNHLAGILSQFSNDYIIDIIKDALVNRFRIYELPSPNVVAAFESNFKAATDGFSSNQAEITATRREIYRRIIDTICDFYGFTFNDSDELDYYSAAYWLYDFLVSNFTSHMIDFYVSYLLMEREQLDAAIGYSNIRRENDVTYSYSKRIFKDPKIAAIHCNIEYIIDQISTFDIDLWTILNYCYHDRNLPSYIFGLVSDTGNFFKNHYERFVVGSDSNNVADIQTAIKLALQEAGKDLEPIGKK